MTASSWRSVGTITRAAERQRRTDLRRQRDLEREEVGRVARGHLGKRDVEPEELPDEPPPGWCGR